MGALSKALQKISIILIQGYRLICSPYFGWNCRFHPTCSQYALQALRSYGFIKGSWLAVTRLGRCHPWGQGGIDRVPPSKGKY